MVEENGMQKKKNGKQEFSERIKHLSWKTKTFIFKIASAPTFPLSQLKKTIIVTKGQEVAIECKPQASPKPIISWKKGDKAVRENKRSDVYSLVFAFDYMDSFQKNNSNHAHFSGNIKLFMVCVNDIISAV